MGAIAKIVRFFGWTLFIVSLIFFVSMIAMFFTVDGSDKWSAVVVGIVFALLAFLGWKIKKFKKAETAAKIVPAVQDHREETINTRKDEKIQDVHIESPIQITKKESVQDMVRAALDIRAEVQAGKRTVKADTPFSTNTDNHDDLAERAYNTVVANRSALEARKGASFDSDLIYHLVYQDFQGDISRRDIRITSIEMGFFDEPSYINAFCYLRQDIRQFRFDRIISLSNDYETIENPQEYLTALFYKTPDYLLAKATEEHEDEIIMLVFISRADGTMRKNEREVILRYIDAVAGNVDADMLDRYIKKMQCDLSEFNKALRRAKKWDDERKAIIFDCISQIYALKKSPDPMEQATFSKIQSALKVK